jgi:hypothetical protein
LLDIKKKFSKSEPFRKDIKKKDLGFVDFYKAFGA